MTDWMEKITKNVHRQIEDYERGKVTLTEDDLVKTMPKVVEFYNAHPEDMDVYRDTNGCILMIQTPKIIKGDDGKVSNKLQRYESEYSSEPQFLLKDVKFRIHNTTKSIGIFAEEGMWKKMGNIYDKKAFIKVPKLKLKYKRVGFEEKAMILSSFLKKHDIEDLKEIEDEYYTFYGANISQVI